MQIAAVIFLLLTIVQIVYIITFLIAITKFDSTNTANEVPVSVIVCGHDELKNLQDLVPILLNQDHKEYEVIIVEDRSNDESFDFLHEACQQHSKLKLVRVKNKPDHVNGKKFALTLGIKAAKHDWVLLTDADCRPNSNQWIKEMSGKFSDDNAIVIGYSPYFKNKGLLNSLIRYETLLTAIQYVGMAIIGRPYMGVGRNLAYRKSLFLENKGFNAHLSITGGDDDLFVNRLSNKRNTAIAIGAQSIVYSKPKTTWKQFYFQKLRHLAVGKNYKFMDKVKSGLFILSMIGTWLLIIPLVFYYPLLNVLIGVFIIRLILLTLLAYKASEQLGEAFEGWKVVYLDFIFVIYYLVVGLAALCTSKVTWKRI